MGATFPLATTTDPPGSDREGKTMNVRKAIAAIALTVVPFAGVMGIAAHNAEAQPKGGPTAKNCPMEVDGKTVYVQPGTRVGLFYCGSDGDWHFGWLVNDVQISQPTT